MDTRYVTKKFGTLMLQTYEIIKFQDGLIGMPNFQKFCFIDAGDNSGILWMQSLDYPEISFPVLEPELFHTHYHVPWQTPELTELGSPPDHTVYTILTIPQDISRMTANLKAPIIVNFLTQTGSQIVLHDAEYSIQHPMFRALKIRLLKAPVPKKDYPHIKALDTLPYEGGV